MSFFVHLYVYFRPFIKKITRDNISAIAGQSAFYLILSSVPLTMFAVSVLQNLHIPEKSLEQIFGMVFNQEATKSFSQFISNIYNDSTGISIVTLVVTLWSAAKGIHSVTNGLNRVNNTYENRNWFVLRIRAMIYTVVIFGIVFASMFILMLGSANSKWISENIRLPGIISVLFNMRYFVIFIYIVLMFVFVFRHLPNISRETRKEYSFGTVLPGAVFTAAAWYILTIVISIYVTDFNGFSIYGGLLRLAVIMVWLYFCMYFLMLGAEINVFYHDKIKGFLNILNSIFWHRKKHK